MRKGSGFIRDSLPLYTFAQISDSVLSTSEVNTLFEACDTKPHYVSACSGACDRRRQCRYGHIDTGLTDDNFRGAITQCLSTHPIDGQCDSVHGTMDNWCTARITKLDSTIPFGYVGFNADLSQWITTSVTRMDSLFEGEGDFNSDISNWDTGAVTRMYMMFRAAASFNQPIGKWVTTAVTNTEYMFADALAFDQPIGKWNTSSITSMKSMFEGATSFNQPLINWDVRKVEHMDRMFGGVYRGEVLVPMNYNHPLDNWETHPDLYSKSMFFAADYMIENWYCPKDGPPHMCGEQITTTTTTVPVCEAGMGLYNGKCTDCLPGTWSLAGQSDLCIPHHRCDGPTEHSLFDGSATRPVLCLLENTAGGCGTNQYRHDFIASGDVNYADPNKASTIIMQHPQFENNDIPGDLDEFIKETLEARKNPSIVIPNNLHLMDFDGHSSADHNTVWQTSFSVHVCIEIMPCREQGYITTIQATATADNECEACPLWTPDSELKCSHERIPGIVGECTYPRYIFDDDDDTPDCCLAPNMGYMKTTVTGTHYEWESGPEITQEWHPQSRDEVDECKNANDHWYSTTTTTQPHGDTTTVATPATHTTTRTTTRPPLVAVRALPARSITPPEVAIIVCACLAFGTIVFVVGNKLTTKPAKSDMKGHLF